LATSDANGQALVYVYSRATQTHALQAKVLTDDEARRRYQHCAVARALGAQGQRMKAARKPETIAAASACRSACCWSASPAAPIGRKAGVTGETVTVKASRPGTGGSRSGAAEPQLSGKTFL
jgi:hypothetical protein